MSMSYQITLTAARITANKPLEEAAKELGMRPGRLAKIEADPSHVILSTVRKICIVYGVPAGLVYWGKASECSERNRRLMKTALLKQIAEEVSQLG